MAWPGGTVSTANMDSAADSPAAARSDLLTMAGYVNDIIASRAAANGIASLNADGDVPLTQMIVGANGLVLTDSGNKIPIGNLPAGTANGVASLGSDGLVPDAQLSKAVRSPVPRIHAFTSAGADTWEVPEGVFRVMAIVTGGGASGGSSAGGSHGGGGGAGGTAIRTFDTTPGNTISVSVGTPGGAATVNGDDGEDGTASELDYTNSATGVVTSMLAGGGKKGLAGDNPDNEGAGGVPTGGQINLAGGQGSGGTSSRGGAGGTGYWGGWGSALSAGTEMGGGGGAGGGAIEDPPIGFSSQAGRRGLIVLYY